MKCRWFYWFLFLALVVLPGAYALADGGTVRAIERVGGMQISVFTSPVVLVAGEADVSVLVQDAATLATVSNAIIEVTLTPRGRPYAAEQVPATVEQATNKLYQASHVTLEAGKYDVVATVTAGDRFAQVALVIEVGSPPTKAATFWPWFAWPLVPIVVFVADQWRKRS